MDLSGIKALVPESIKPTLKEYLQLAGFRRIYELSFWLNYRCVYDCPYCIIEEKGSMMLDKKLVLQYVDEAIPMKLNHVIVTGGEPLLHPDFEEICNGIMDRGLPLSISTTGHTKNVDLLMPLVDRGAVINICINSSQRDVNDRLRGKGALEASSALAGRLRDKGVYFRGAMVVSRPNLNHIMSTAEYMFDELGFPSVTVYMGAPNGEFLKHAQELVLSEGEIKEYYRILTDAVKRFNKKEKRLVPLGLFDKPVKYCGAFGYANVLPDGLITHCCYFFDENIALGTIEGTLKEAHSFSNSRRVKKMVMECLEDSEERINKLGAFSCYDCMVAYKKKYQGIDVAGMVDSEEGVKDPGTSNRKSAAG